MTTEEPCPGVFRRTLIQSIVLPEILLAILAIVFLGLIADLLAATRSTEHTDLVIAKTHRLHARVVDRDTRVRGYLLTGKPEFLRPAVTVTKSFEADLDDLLRLVAKDPVELRRVEAIRDEVVRWDGHVQRLIEHGKRGANRVDEAEAVAVDKSEMDAIRHGLTNLLRDEENIRDGRSRAARWTVQAAVGAALVATTLLGTILAISTRRQLVKLSGAYAAALEAAQKRSESLSQLAAIVESSDDAIIGTDLDGLITSWNDGAERLYGYAAAEVMAQRLSLLVPSGLDEETARIDAQIRSGEVAHYVTRPRTRDGRLIDVSLTVSPVRDADSRIIGASIIARDITEQKQAEERLAHQAMHDALTGLANRARFTERLEQAIRSSRADDSAFALLMVDLDRFKEINDTFGHHYGDVILQTMAARLTEALREADRLARLGGDEFGIFLPAADEASALAVADRILDASTAPILVEGQSLEVGASVGIALYPSHGRDSQTLLEHADAAMYVAKRYHRGRAVYTAAPDDSSPRSLSLVGELRRAIDEDRLLLYYQPKFDLTTMRLDGAEALLRWPHPEEGLMPASEFIALAERTGLSRALSVWALETAVRHGSAWHQSAAPLPVAVNLAPDHLLDDRLIETTTELLERSGAPPGWLTLEISERTMMADPGRVKTVLERVHEIGVRIAIDDFGVGYSSLAHLKELPVDEVKVDRSFVKDMATNERDARLVRSVIELGHTLGFRVLAEGVEDQAGLDRLASWGCDLAQGYYFSRPLSEPDFLQWVASGSGLGREPFAETSRPRLQHATST